MEKIALLVKRRIDFFNNISSFVKKYSVIVNIFGFVIIILYFFGIGSLIGWIVGKIKSKKQI